MKKRLICILTLITILFSVFPIATSASDNSDGAFDLLDALSVGDFNKNDQTINRGQFVSAISDVINYNNRPGPKNGIFSDVTSADKYSGAVYSIYEMGFISGYSDGAFKAESPILFDHAAKVLVSALGYDIIAQNKGGYPGGYFAVANELKLFDGTTKAFGENLTASDAAIFIENALNCEVMAQSSFGSTGVYETQEGRTFLYEYAKIKKINGVVSDNGYTSLIGESKAGEGYVIIDGEKYDVSNSFAGEYFGYRVDAYVTCDDATVGKVLFVSPDADTKVLSISAERLLADDSDFSTENIVYNDVHGDKTKAKISLGADVIYNGVAYNDLKEEDLNLSFGDILLIDNSDESGYDVVVINAVEIIVVEAINLTTETIYSTDGQKFELGSAESFVVYRDGIKTDLSAIKPFDTVRASISLDKRVVTLDVCSERIIGKVDEYNSSLRSVKINGEFYHVSTDELMASIELGKEYEFCLDSKKNIVATIGETRASNTAGIVIASSVGQGLDSSVKVKIFTQNGRMEIFECSNRIVIDGQSDLSDAEIASYIENNMKHKLASYKLDGDKKIRELSLPYKGSPASHQNHEDLRIDYDANEGVYYSASQKNFGGKFVVDSTTVVFEVPASDMTQYDDYRTRNLTGFGSNDLCKIEAYSVGAEDGISDYIIYKSDIGAFANDSNPFVVDEITSILNDDGDPVEKITGFSYKGAVEYISGEADAFTSKGIKPGDIVRCVVDSKNVCRNTEKIVDGENKQLLITPKTSFFSSPRMILLNVYSRYGNILNCTTTDLSGNYDENEVLSKIEKQVVSGFAIYVVNMSEKDIVRPGTASDIYSYETVGESYSKVFVHTYSGASRLMVIYQ